MMMVNCYRKIQMSILDIEHTSMKCDGHEIHRDIFHEQLVKDK